MLVGYARVSPNDERPEHQFVALRAAGCNQISVEEKSAAQRDRPELNKTLDRLRDGDTLVVWKLDRLARSVRQLIATVEQLAQRNIGFRSLSEGIDITSPNGSVVLHVFKALQGFERSIVAEHTRAGLQSARALGRKGGRPRALTERDLIAARTLLTRNRKDRLGVRIKRLAR